LAAKNASQVLGRIFGVLYIKLGFGEAQIALWGDSPADLSGWMPFVLYMAARYARTAEFQCLTGGFLCSGELLFGECAFLWICDLGAL